MTCTPKTGPEFILGFGPKTEDVFYGPLHQMTFAKITLHNQYGLSGHLSKIYAV